jgi:hypothetical protein
LRPVRSPISFERTLGYAIKDMQSRICNQAHRLATANGEHAVSRFSLTHLSKRPHLTYMQPCALRVAFKTHLAGRDGAVSAREAEFME